MDHLRIFGCRAHALIPADRRPKLGAQSRLAIYLGPSSEHATDHRLLVQDTNAIIVTRDVVFQEHIMPAKPQQPDCSPRGAEPITPPPTGTELGLRGATSPPPSTEHADDDSSSDNDDPSSSDHEPEVHNVTLADYAFVAEEPITPNSYKEALTSPDAAKWKQAMIDEYNSLRSNGTFSLVPCLRGRKPIATRWLYKVKHRADGSIERYKARWVAKGFTQRHGIDYFNTFAPVCRTEGLRMLIALAVAEDFEIHAIDIDTAFLHARLEDDTLVTQPEGFVDPDHPDWVCRLHKSLYGLKQAPLEWFKTIDAHLRANGFEPSDADPCIYVRHYKGLRSYIALYVDDCTIIAHRCQIHKIKDMVKAKFPTKDLGEAKSVLGFKIHHDRKNGRIYILQRGKIDAILQAFGLSNCKPVPTPMLSSTALDQPPADQPPIDFPYRQAIGMLSYLAHASRPDILYAVTQVSQFVNNFSHDHVIAVKHIMRYLAGTRNLAISYDQALYDRKEPTSLLPVTYCDANWGGNLPDRKSVTGLVVLFCGGPIYWSSKFQRNVALSTTEAELTAISEAARQVLYMRRLLPVLHIPTDMPLEIHNDNQGALKILESTAPPYHGRMKHYDIKTAHLRDTAKKGEIKFKYCPTTEMPADILTKALSRSKFIALRQRLVNTLTLAE
jgi:hypothetical protein